MGCGVLRDAGLRKTGSPKRIYVGLRKSWANTMLRWGYGEMGYIFAALLATQNRPFRLSERWRNLELWLWRN